MANSNRTNGHGREGLDDAGEEEQATLRMAEKYQVSSLTIPPFRGGGTRREGARRAAGSAADGRCGTNSTANGHTAGNAAARTGVVTSSLNSYMMAGGINQNNNHRGKSSWRGSLLLQNQQEVDFDPPISLDSSDYDLMEDAIDISNKTAESSTGNDSSVGVQSNFIKGLIQKQKKRGNWNSSIAPSTATGSAVSILDCSVKSKRPGRNSGAMKVRRVNSHNSLDGMDTTNDSQVSLTNMARNKNDHDRATIKHGNRSDEVINGRESASDNRGRETRIEGRNTFIEPTSLEKQLSLQDISDFINDENDSDDDDLLMAQSRDTNKQGGGDDHANQSMSKSTAGNRRRYTDGDSSQSSTSEIQPLNNALLDGQNDKNSLSPNHHNNIPATIEKEKQPPNPSFKRCLSSTSLVSMLKIQPIGEYNELHDDIRKYNLEETVQAMSRASSSDNVSEFTNDDEDNDSDGIGIDEGIDDGQGIETDSTVGDSTRGSDENDINEDKHNNKTMGNEKSSSSGFLPFVDIENDVPGGRSTIVDKMNTSRHRMSESDSDTFYLQSMQSAESITHVSDAPDYDYYSISSEDEDDDTASVSGENRKSVGREAKDVVKDQVAVGSTSIMQQTKSSSITPPPPNEQSMSNNAPKVIDPNAKKLNKEVCDLLGLPKDNIRKVHRGIMSHNTELQLRKMVGKEQKPKQDGVIGRSGGPKNGVSKDAQPLPTSEQNATANSSRDNKDAAMVEEKPTSYNDDSSSSSEEDLAFGPSQTKDGDLEKWEKIRLERRSSRASTRRSRSSANSSSFASGVAVAEVQREETDDDGRNSTNELDRTVDSRQKRRTQPRIHMPGLNRRSSDDSDTSTVVSELKRTFSQGFSNVYHRLSRNNIYHRSSSNSTNSRYHSDSDDDEESTDDEDEGPSWDKNILTEGEYYLAMSMLVYIYALLRETSLLGHTDIGFDEIDVNSFQSDPGFGGSSGNLNGDKSRYLSKTKSAGFIIRVVMDELEKKGAFSSVEKNEGDMSVLKEFKKWVADSRSKQLDAATEATIKELRRKVARRRWKRAIHAVRLMVRLGHSDSNSFAMRLNQRKAGKRFQPGGLAESLTGGMADSMQALANKLKKPPRPPLGISNSMMWMHDQRNHIMNSLGIASSDAPSSSQETSLKRKNSLVGESEIKEIINDALEEPRFFMPGSLLSNLIESGIEVVLFGDRHPNDVVYSICVNRQYKRVSVVFRGTVNTHNWIMNMKFSMSEHTNPITADYPGRSDVLGLHTGFLLYMTRQRKDDSLTKIEEIFSHIDNIGRELAPEGDYELSITGHSLGGALATILSFHAATSNMFAKVKNIRVFTYAAPRVGCDRFLHAYQYLEKIGKLRHARFTNTRDIVPLIPFHGISRAYKHVGLHIRLHGVNKYAQYWLRQALDVTYPKRGLLSQLWRGCQSSLVRNLNTVQGYTHNHTLSEYQRRIRFALEYRSMLAQAGFFHSRKRNRLKTLDEYYFIKGASNVTCTGELTRISLEERAKERVRREARKVVIFLLVIVLLEGVILAGVLKHSVHCVNYPIFLYPLLFITGCHKGESGSTYSIARDAEEIPASPQKSTIKSMETINERMGLSNLEEKTNALIESSPETAGLNNNTDDFFSSDTTSPSWTSFWMNWLWGWKSHDRPPCFWGRCTILSRPYRPWGVIIQHKPLPSTIDYWSFDSNMLRDIAQDADTF